MPGRDKGKFAGRMTSPPRPLPDDEPTTGAQPGRPPFVPVRETAASVSSATAATTIRLRPAAAEPLNAAWLNERRLSDPKLSYPEFASMIVRLGLAAYEEQQRGD